MKKPQFQFALALLSICALTACNTVKGMGKDAGDITDWANNKPSTIGKVIGDAPTGYKEKPASQTEATDDTESSSVAGETPQPFSGGNLVWHQLNNYNAEKPALPDGQEPMPLASPSRKVSGTAPVVQYSPSVDVFPVNGDLEPYAQLTNAGGDSSISGEMIQQVFFPYGSSRISKIDHRSLSELAQSLIQNHAEYRLDVVGHASKRVNHVKDPLRRKMINFKMAQKRANAVAGVLMKAGATPDWIVATSEGDSQPNPHRNGKSQDAADRRAEVYLKTN